MMERQPKTYEDKTTGDEDSGRKGCEVTFKVLNRGSGKCKAVESIGGGQIGGLHLMQRVEMECEEPAAVAVDYGKGTTPVKFCSGCFHAAHQDNPEWPDLMDLRREAGWDV